MDVCAPPATATWRSLSPLTPCQVESSCCAPWNGSCQIYQESPYCHIQRHLPLTRVLKWPLPPSWNTSLWRWLSYDSSVVAILDAAASWPSDQIRALWQEAEAQPRGQFQMVHIHVTVIDPLTPTSHQSPPIWWWFSAWGRETPGVPRPLLGSIHTEGSGPDAVPHTHCLWAKHQNEI